MADVHSALRRGLHLRHDRSEFAPTLPYLLEQLSPGRRHPVKAGKPAEPGARTARALTGWSGSGSLVESRQQVFLPARVALTVMDAREALARSRGREALAERFTLSRKHAQKGVLALGLLNSLAFRKKRHQADTRDAPLTSTPTTTISATGGGAFILPSSSSVQRLLHATIFPSSETVLSTSADLRFLCTPMHRSTVEAPRGRTANLG
jgi:hypothetical protein